MSAERWKVHVEGPDDVYGYATRKEADAAAAEINELYERLLADDPSPYTPRIHAVVYSANQWAAIMRGDSASVTPERPE